MSHPPAPRAEPDANVAKLGALVGHWKSTGFRVDDPSITIIGTDTYAWLPGGFFLVHHVDVLVGDQPVQALELIGSYDPATDFFTAQAFDNLGQVTVMRVRVDQQGTWTFTGGPDIARAAQPREAAPEGAVRSRLTISADGTRMHADWERSDDRVAWQPWMDMAFERQPDPDQHRVAD